MPCRLVAHMQDRTGDVLPARPKEADALAAARRATTDVPAQPLRSDNLYNNMPDVSLTGHCVLHDQHPLLQDRVNVG